MKRVGLVRGVLSYGVLVGLAAVVGFPLLWMVVSSLKPAAELFTRPPRLVPAALTLQWYADVVWRTEAPRLFANSFVVATATMLGNMVLATLAAYGTTRFRFWGRDTMLLAILAAYVLPAILLVAPLYLALNWLRLVDTLAGVTISHLLVTLPFSVWLLRSFFLAIPREIDEAALVDGATYFGAFRRLILPLAAPGVLSTGLLAFILSWSEFLFSSVLLTSGAKKTLPVGIAEFVTAFDIRWGEIMALGTVTTVPILLFFALIQRYFVRGLLAGAVKG
jgi:ABC-type glycerol-3-phosphate transport system permease component